MLKLLDNKGCFIIPPSLNNHIDAKATHNDGSSISMVFFTFSILEFRQVDVCILQDNGKKSLKS